MPDAGGTGTGDDLAALARDDFSEATGDLGVIDDAGLGDMDAGNADRVGRELANSFGTDSLADNAVLWAAFEERFHSRQFRFVGGDDDLATEVEGDVLARAELLHRFFAGTAVDGFERAGAVVDARVHHAGVAASLVTGDGGFFFEDGDALAGEPFEEAVSGGESDDAATDDDEIGFRSRVLQGPIPILKNEPICGMIVA